MIIQPDSPDITLRCGKFVMYDHDWDDSVFFDMPDFIDPGYPGYAEHRCRFKTDIPHITSSMMVK